MRKVIQIIPYDGVGGVETAARSLKDGVYNGMVFKKYYLFRLESHRSFLHRFFAYIKAVMFLYREKPDVVISSLWRSCIVAVMVKLLSPSVKLVTFFHLAKNVHFFDYFWNRMSAQLSSEIWADSQTTLDARFSQLRCIPRKVISFLVLDLSPPKHRKNQPVFIFWGRLHAQKGLIRAIRIFASICESYPQARYHIIGPDGGAETELRSLCNRLGVERNVIFHGSKAQNEIFQYAAATSYYLQCSEVEGMAMSVVEAMQLGLVPVVTAVGEIANYCNDQNSIVIDHQDKYLKVLSSLNNDDYYFNLSTNAVKYWNGKTKYPESVIAACTELLRLTQTQD